MSTCDSPGMVVTSVVVTHNRINDLRVCLCSLREQTRPPDTIIVVDNACTDGTPEFLASQADITVVRLEHNVGASGGFRYGMARALQGDPSWLWIMDDDCVPAPNSLELLLRAAEEKPKTLAGVVPAVCYSDGRVEYGYTRTGGNFRSPIHPVSHGSASVDMAPFLALLLRADACRDVGEVREDFFIWHDDVEYCLRLRVKGYSLIAEPEATVAHPAQARSHTRRVLGRSIALNGQPPWKEYYGTRNRLIVDNATEGTCMSRGRSLPWRLAREVALIVRLLVQPSQILIQPHTQLRRVHMRAKGVMDGVLGRSGPRVLPPVRDARRK